MFSPKEKARASLNFLSEETLDDILRSGTGE
jgi:hypothetical protein